MLINNQNGSLRIPLFHKIKATINVIEIKLIPPKIINPTVLFLAVSGLSSGVGVKGLCLVGVVCDVEITEEVVLGEGVPCGAG